MNHQNFIISNPKHSFVTLSNIMYSREANNTTIEKINLLLIFSIVIGVFLCLFHPTRSFGILVICLGFIISILWYNQYNSNKIIEAY